MLRISSRCTVNICRPTVRLTRFGPCRPSCASLPVGYTAAAAQRGRQTVKQSPCRAGSAAFPRLAAASGEISTCHRVRGDGRSRIWTRGSRNRGGMHEANRRLRDTDARKVGFVDAFQTIADDSPGELSLVELAGRNMELVRLRDRTGRLRGQLVAWGLSTVSLHLLGGRHEGDVSQGVTAVAWRVSRMLGLGALSRGTRRARSSARQFSALQQSHVRVLGATRLNRPRHWAFADGNFKRPRPEHGGET